VCCCNWWALTLRTVCLNTEWATGIWHSWLKHLKCWWNSVKKLICYSCIFNVQLYVHLKKRTLKFKLLYLQNLAVILIKFAGYVANTHIQNLKVWLKSVLPWLKYSLLEEGLFFIGTPCRSRVWIQAGFTESKSGFRSVNEMHYFTEYGFVNQIKSNQIYLAAQNNPKNTNDFTNKSTIGKLEC